MKKKMPKINLPFAKKDKELTIPDHVVHGHKHADDNYNHPNDKKHTKKELEAEAKEEHKAHAEAKKEEKAEAKAEVKQAEIIEEAKKDVKEVEKVLDKVDKELDKVKKEVQEITQELEVATKTKEESEEASKTSMKDKVINTLSINKDKSEINKNIPMIDVQRYTKVFGKFTSTENVTFEVGHGVIHGFIGPNGSGKTTTIKAMIGAYIPTDGQIFINGRKAGTKGANSLVGYIPERASFPRHLNTISYLSAMGELSGLKPKESKETALRILKELQLEKQAKRKPTTFSSGMQKKILLAQALLTNPSVLILDEPAANLDPTARKELFDSLIKLRDEGKTIIISSHILSELERLIDEATFIYYGEVIFTGKIDDVLKKHATAFIRSTDNAKLAQHLLELEYKVSGDVKSEIQISNLTDELKSKLFKELEKVDVNIISYRTNDLQSVYDVLAKQASKHNLGKQKLGDESTVKHVFKPGDTQVIRKKPSKPKKTKPVREAKPKPVKVTKAKKEKVVKTKPVKVKKVKAKKPSASKGGK